MYTIVDVAITEGMRAELEKRARGPGGRWRMMASYALKTGVYAGLGMSALILFGYTLALGIDYVFPSAKCRPSGLKLFGALPFAAIAAAFAAWFGNTVWQHQIATAARAQKALAVGICREESFMIPSRHILAFDGESVCLFVPAANGKTFVVVADADDPRAAALTDAQGEAVGSHWRWHCESEAGVVADLEIGGEPIKLTDGIWLEGSAFWDKIDEFPADGDLLNMPFEQVERLINEDADHNATVKAGDPTPTLASRLFRAGRAS
jgi:hypothetical protein